MSLPTRMADTQQAIAVSSLYAGRISSSFSYWMELLSSDTCAQNRLKPSGNAGDHRTVRFGSGAGPRLYSVCRYRSDVSVPKLRPPAPIPPIASVTQVG